MLFNNFIVGDIWHVWLFQATNEAFIFFIDIIVFSVNIGVGNIFLTVWVLFFNEIH